MRNVILLSLLIINSSIANAQKEDILAYSIINAHVQEVDTFLGFRYFFGLEPITINFEVLLKGKGILEGYTQMNNQLDSIHKINVHNSDTFTWDQSQLKLSILNRCQVDSMTWAIRISNCTISTNKSKKIAQKAKSQEDPKLLQPLIRNILLNASYPVFLDKNHMLIAFNDYEIGSTYYYSIEVYVYKLNEAGVWVKDKLVYSASG
jgi:hypothetical protein